MRWMRFLLTISLGLALFGVSAEEAKLLSLHDAILLSLRYNANVRTAELNRVTQKFALEVAKWQFQPKYSFSAGDSWSTSRSGSSFSPMTQSWNAGPGVSWDSPIGTTVNVSQDNNWGGDSQYNPSVSVQIIQPLIAGFGEAVVEASLRDAYDTEKTNKLNLKQTIMSQVTATIAAYMNLVGAENSVDVDQQSVDRAKTNLFQTKLLIQAGQNPQSDATQAEAQVAQALAQLQADKSQLIISRYQLLQIIGLNPTANIRIVHDVPLEKYHLPSVDQNIQAALENNVSYQVSEIAIASTARSVMTAKDANRWSLNLEEDYSRGGAVDDTSLVPPSTALNANNLLGGGVNNIVNNSAYGSTTSLNLTIPIDNKSNQGAILDAEIALQEAQINLKQAKQNLTIQVMSTRDSLVSSAMQIKLDTNQVNYDKQTLDNTLRSYRAGIASSLQVSQQSQTYTNDQHSLVSAKIAYFNQLATFDQLYGHTLDTWGIQVQY